MMISSEMLAIPLQYFSTFWMTCWYFSGAEVMPNITLFQITYLCMFSCHMNPGLDLMVAPLEIRFTEDVTWVSHIFNYFINCGNRVSLTNDCFVGPPTTFLYFALRHNWYDVSSVVTTSLNHHIYNCFRIDDHLRIVQLENACFSLAGYWTSLAKDP